MKAGTRRNGGYTTNPQTTYPQVGENVYWQRDVKQVMIFSEDTGESMAGNMTAGRIIELSDGTRSVEEIGKILMREFADSPPEEEVLAFISEFLTQCQEKEFITLRSEPATDVHREEFGEFTSTDVENLIKENAVVVMDERASFEATEDGSLMTYSTKDGKYLTLTLEEKDILMALLEERPLQDIRSEISEKYGIQGEEVLTKFIHDMLNHGLARVQKEN
jgi:hypothetical protein